MEENEKKLSLATKTWGGSFLFCAIVIIYIASSFIQVYFPISSPIVSILVTQGSIVVPAIIYIVFFMKENPLRFIRFKKFNIVSALLVWVMMFTLIPVMAVLNAISMLFATNTVGAAIDNITGGNVWIGLALVALLPAFVEEITFRGAIYHSLRGARPVRAIILSGFMFGAMHMNFNQFVYAAALGIIMAFLLEATGSILATILLHFSLNANSVILSTLLPKLMKLVEGYSSQSAGQITADVNSYTTAQMLSTILILLPFAVVGAALAFVLYILIAKLNQRWGYIKFLFAKSTKSQRDALEKPRWIYALECV